MLVVIRLSRGLSARTSICKEHAKCNMDQILTVESREHDATVKGRYLWQVKPLKYKKNITSVMIGNWAFLNWLSEEIWDCIVLLYFAMWLVQKTSHHCLNQSDPKLTQITTKAIWFYFEFSLALKGILLSSDWPLWLLGFLFYDSPSPTYV